MPLTTSTSSSSLLASLTGGADDRRAPTLEAEDRTRKHGFMAHGLALARRGLQESVLLTRLAWRLWSYLGMGYKWAVQLLRLVLYAMLLLPGFLQMVVFYCFSSRVVRSVVYGPKPRQRLDLYLPPGGARPHKDRVPMVVYITGGAWIIGYKAWGAILARRLSRQGVLVACLDYRNFPQGDALAMLEDVNTGIAWCLDNVRRYGVDPDAVTLVGQSAGGHLAALALIKQTEQAVGGGPACHTLAACPAWSPRSLRAFVGVSGAYDLRALADHLHARGMYKELFERIMSINRMDTLGVPRRSLGEVLEESDADVEGQQRSEDGAEQPPGAPLDELEPRGNPCRAPASSGAPWSTAHYANANGAAQPQASLGAAAGNGHSGSSGPGDSTAAAGGGRPQRVCAPGSQRQEAAAARAALLDSGSPSRSSSGRGEQCLEANCSQREDLLQHHRSTTASRPAHGSAQHQLQRKPPALRNAFKASSPVAADPLLPPPAKRVSFLGGPGAQGAHHGVPHPAYELLSPLEALRRLPRGAVAEWMPPVVLVHGTADITVPYAGSVALDTELQAAGGRSVLHLIPGKTHTSFLLEDPMRGGTDLLTDLVLSAAEGVGLGGGEGASEAVAAAAQHQRVYTTLCPGFLCDLAARVCPF